MIFADRFWSSVVRFLSGEFINNGTCTGCKPTWVGSGWKVSGSRLLHRSCVTAKDRSTRVPCFRVSCMTAKDIGRSTHVPGLQVSFTEVLVITDIRMTRFSQCSLQVKILCIKVKMKEIMSNSMQIFITISFICVVCVSRIRSMKERIKEIITQLHAANYNYLIYLCCVRVQERDKRRAW